MISEEKQREVLEDYILPLFSGSVIMGERESTIKGGQLAAISANKLEIKFDKSDIQRFVIKRSQPFTGKDSSLVKRFLQKIQNIDETAFYADSIYGICLEKSICEELSAEVSNTIESIIEIYTHWSLRTYEGRHPSFGVIIDVSRESGVEADDALKVQNCMVNDYAAPLTDGISSYFYLTRDGYVLSHETLDGIVTNDIFAPYRFASFAEKCNNGNLGLVLSSNGEVLIFVEKEMKYAKRQGKWKLFDHQTAIERLSDKSKYMDKSIRNEMYLTALDVSFAKTGGCIGYVNKTQLKEVYTIIDENDQLANRSNMNDKAKFIKKLIGDIKFQKMSRKMRQELAGIDGAIVIDNDGNIIACGTIIKQVKSSAEGGGRLAATKQLSIYGPAIKISADGGISVYHKDKELIAIG